MRRVVLSVTLIVGVIASLAAYSPSALASTAAATKTKTTTFTLSCDTGLADGDVSVSTTQTYPVSVAAGKKFTIKWSSVTTVEGALASAAYAVAPGGSEDGTITTDNDLSSDGTPSPSNLAGSGLSEKGIISSPSSFNVYTPTTTGTSVNGTFTTPKFKAGTKGKDKVSAQDDDANITIYNKSGTEVDTTTADCTPVGTPKVIATISVT